MGSQPSGELSHGSYPVGIVQWEVVLIRSKIIESRIWAIIAPDVVIIKRILKLLEIKFVYHLHKIGMSVSLY